ncbi:unnamed protein product [Effrenium voratum]|nr:unnamed protein product [Effrenium voratum]
MKVSEPTEAQKKNKELVTVLTAIDQDSQAPFAVVVPSKGGAAYAVGAISAWVKDLGWDKVTIHTDQENSLNHLYEKVTDKLGNDKVQLRKSPRYSSASLGSGEMVNGLIAGKIRTWLVDLRERYGNDDIDIGHVLFPWIVRHVSWSMARFHVNKTKTTAHRILKGHDYLGELLPMGETVMAKYPNVKDRAKSDSRWVKGIYAGKTTQLDEHIVLTEAGADTFRTVRRLPLGSQHQLVVLEQARGAPWNTVEGIEKAKPEGIRSKVDVRQLQEPILETEVTRGSGSAGDIAPREREIPPVFVPAPKISGRSIDPDGLTCQDFKKKQSPEERLSSEQGRKGVRSIQKCQLCG